MSVIQFLYACRNNKKEKKGRMDLTQMESEVQALFGITDGDDAAGETTSGEAPPPQNSDDATQTGEGTSPEGTEPAAPATQTPAQETPPPTGSSKEDAPLNPEEKFNKQDRAFAQMRVQNKEYSDLIMNLAKATGQEPKNIAEAQEILKGGLSKVVSKNRNIPEDVLREMEEDKRAIAEYKQAQARQKALAGFQNVKDTFGLSREDVNRFADKLIEHKLNPFEQDLDLVKEYRNLYFEELITKAKEQGVQEERARSLKAQQNSTTPSTQKGVAETTGNQGTPVKTVKDLEKLLDGLK
jgi:hypothetical protein